MSEHIVMLGDANVDLVIRLPQYGGLQSLSEPALYGGGTVANSTVAAARLGVPVAFVGMVGDDGYGRFIQDDLAGEGVDTRGLRVGVRTLTPMVIAVIDGRGERTIFVWPPTGSAHTHLRPEDIDPAVIRRAAWLHTSGLCLRAAPEREAVLHGMRLAREAGVPVSIDLNLRLELWGWGDNIRETIGEAMELADVVMGSGIEEIVPLAQIESVEAAARILSDNKRIVIARLGIEGALVVSPSGAVRVPSFPAQVVDTLGAGDAFNGGFIAARVLGHGVHEAVRWGNGVAALKITRSGARGVPTRTELDCLLESWDPDECGGE